MLKVQEIRELIKLIDRSNIDEFTYEYDDVKIKMKKNNGGFGVAGAEAAPVVQQAAAVEQAEKPQVQAPVEQAAPVQKEEPAPAKEANETAEASSENLHKITSPMVGTFYAAPAPDADPYVKVGSKVTKDSIVCIVEAMKLFNEIEAEVDGEIVEILVENGQLVEYGQPLFLVKVD